MKKVAVALTIGWWPKTSIDFGGYCQALARLGHSPLLICHSNNMLKVDFPVVEAGSDGMEQVDFWRSLGLDAVIFFNWLRAPRIVTAMKQAGLVVISRGDTDGRTSGRVFPKAAWLTMESSDDPMLVRLRKAKYLVERYLTLSIAEDQALIETIDQSDAVAIECEEAARNLRRILAYYKRSDLGTRVHAIPHSVSDEILSETIYEGQRPRTILCGGRWNAPQKDPHLLSAALERVLRRQQDIQVVIVGDGPDNLFQPLTNRHPDVKWLRRVPHEEVATLLKTCRLMVSSSRWEGYSILALEALCMGCTFAAPPLPGFVDMSEDGRFGTISSRRTPGSLARAIETELELWDRGARIPGDISAVWRKRASNDAVISDLLALIK